MCCGSVTDFQLGINIIFAPRSFKNVSSFALKSGVKLFLVCQVGMLVCLQGIY